MIDIEPKLNIFANVYNPIRLFVLMVNMFKTFSKVVENIDKLFDSMFERIEKLAVIIIDKCDNPGILRNWIFDDYDSSYQVIDMLGYLDLLNILGHPKIAKIVEQLWNGNFDPALEYQDMIANFKYSEQGKMYRNYNINTDQLLSIISLDYPFALFSWMFTFISDS